MSKEKGLLSEIFKRHSLSFVLTKPIKYENYKNEIQETLNEFDKKETLDEDEDIETIIVPYQSKGNINEDSILLNNTYSFIKTYLSLIKQSSSESKYPSILKFPIQINIRDYKQEEGIFFDYITYEIDGIYKENKFTVFRRYKEFIYFRKILLTNWPGILIPPLPGTKIFGGLDDAFINVRKKFLQQFCNKLAACPHLASALESKIFFEEKTENYLDIPFEMYTLSIEEIYSVYQKYFDFLKEKTITDKERIEVHNFYLYLLEVQKEFEKFDTISIDAKNLQTELGQAIKQLMENNYMVENTLFEMNNIKDKTLTNLNKSLIEINLNETMFNAEYENLYTVFYEFIQNIIIDNKAMSEAISTVFLFNKNFNEKIEKLKALNKILYKKSHKNLIQKFFFEIDLEEIQNLINETKKLKNEIEILHKMIELLYKILYFIVIPSFKNDQHKFYLIFINKIKESEKFCHNKDISVYSLFNQHCEEIIKYLKVKK